MLFCSSIKTVVCNSDHFIIAAIVIPKSYSKRYKIISIMNEEVYYLPFHEKLCVPKCLGIGTTQFHYVAISDNGLHSCFILTISFQKVFKHQNLASLCKFPFPC